MQRLQPPYGRDHCCAVYPGHAQPIAHDIKQRCSVVHKACLYDPLLFVAVLCEAQSMLSNLWQRPVLPPCTAALYRLPAVRRTRSMMLVPCASQELPAPQLMHLELHPRSPLPALSTLAGTFDAPSADLHVTTHGRCPTSVSDTGLTPTHQQHQVHEATAASNTGTHMASTLPAMGSMAALQGVMVMQPVIQAAATAAAADQAASGAHMSHGAGPTLSELLQVPDDIQAGLDSPIAMSRAGYRRSLAPLPPRSLTGTPSATCKVQEQEE
jgi:hypothetical protein